MMNVQLTFKECSNLVSDRGSLYAGFAVDHTALSLSESGVGKTVVPQDQPCF